METRNSTTKISTSRVSRGRPTREAAKPPINTPATASAYNQANRSARTAHQAETWISGRENPAEPLPRHEDFISLTAVAHRPQDLADIKAILVVHPQLHLRRVRRWLQAFSEALSMPGILRDFETLLSQGRKGRT
jgi:hypothetical protein